MVERRQRGRAQSRLSESGEIFFQVSLFSMVKKASTEAPEEGPCPRLQIKKPRVEGAGTKNASWPTA